MAKLCTNCKSKSYRYKNMVKIASLCVNYHSSETHDELYESYNTNRLLQLQQ